MVTRKKSFKRV